MTEHVTMEVTGEHTIDQVPNQLWDTLLDPETLEATIPGAESLDRDGDHYEGSLERGLAGISLTLDADVEITEKERIEYIKCEIIGTDNTINSRVDGEAFVEFEVTEDDETILVYETEFDFSGKLASLGSRIIKRKMNQDLQTFFNNLEEYVDDQQATV
ncbi:hypothetical protein DMJ13_21230 [halophilic archaeon]|nr:hypothetical protein DMJ13_21230 [halophilic archaeon]